MSREERGEITTDEELVKLFSLLPNPKVICTFVMIDIVIHFMTEIHDYCVCIPLRFLCTNYLVLKCSTLGGMRMHAFHRK